MSKLTLASDCGTSLLALSNNLKVAIATKLYKPDLDFQNKEDESGLKLKNNADGFELVEANSIVKYLSNDFSTLEDLDFEETVLFSALKSGKMDEIEGALKSRNFSFGKDVSASLIILFASVYALFKDKPDLLESFAEFKQFKALPKVQEAIKKTLSITKVERSLPKNDGKRHVKTGYLVKPRGDKILPKEGEKNILVTSALPYVNNVPHLGNIVGSVLSADIFARYAKNRNVNCLFVCGTDEYGTATETKALEEKVTPKELCDKYYEIHKEVYEWFELGFDYFGRTTTEHQTTIAQDIFMKLYENGYLEEKTTSQLYCEVHNAFLADRFVEGTCPKCGYEDARGDQCDKCGVLLNPLELIKPRCKLDDATPVPRDSTHLYLKLNELEPPLKEWFEKTSQEGSWSKNSKTITNSWLKQGLESRCITRDLKWGTAVPLKGYENKVLYVWFDAPIGYVSITANYFDKGPNEEWAKWWKNPEHVLLYQFMGKDNVPFHSVVFPASQIGTKDNWTKLHHLSTTEYLQYEDGKFSKSRGVGVFGNNAKDTNIPASVWRYYLASIRPETADAHFSWAEFVTKNNSELLANLGNFVNRLTKFAVAKYNGVIPEFNQANIPNVDTFFKEINSLLSEYIHAMDHSSLRRGLELAMAISSKGNQFLQDNKLDNSLFTNAPDRSDAVVAVGLNLIYLVGALVSPFMPATSAQIFDILNAPPLSITDQFELVLEAGHCIGKPQYLFKRIDEKKIDEWRALYGGKQQV